MKSIDDSTERALIGKSRYAWTGCPKSMNKHALKTSVLRNAKRARYTRAVSMGIFEHGFLRGCFFMGFGHRPHGYLHCPVNSRSAQYVLFASSTAPPVYPGGRRRIHSRPHEELPWLHSRWSGMRSAPLLARPKSWPFLRECENWCHGDCLGTREIA